MKITLIYDNTVYQKGLRSDWGFSCLIEVEDAPKILFDTGTKGGILLGNMEKMSIDPRSVEAVFISHAHYDHTGGLPDFLKVNPEVTVYLPPSCSNPLMAREVVTVSNSLQIEENIFSTGTLRGVEQSLAVKTGKGIVVIAGCSHPGVGTILQSASQFGEVYALVGGLHGFRDFALLEEVQQVCPCHCTQYTEEIKKLFPEKYIPGGAGKVIVF